MMFSTALSHFESAGTQTVPATQKKDRKQKASLGKARFIGLTPPAVLAEYSVAASARSTGAARMPQLVAALPDLHRRTRGGRDHWTAVCVAARVMTGWLLLMAALAAAGCATTPGGVVSNDPARRPARPNAAADAGVATPDPPSEQPGVVVTATSPTNVQFSTAGDQTVMS